MNKFIIVFLAVCLVSVHAFVRRDAPAEAGTDIVNQIQTGIKDIGDKIKSAFNPDELQKSLDEMAKNVQNVISQLQKQGGQPAQ